MKREVFIKDYAQASLNIEEKDYKNKHKADVYYFNVDLKFIIKARLQKARKEFEQHVKGSLKSGQKWMCKSCEFGEERIYDEVNASSLRFKCDHCGRNLVEVVETNKLNEEEEDKCRRAIEDLKKKLTKFDNYIVPANFFGPGHLSAYVGLITTQ
jgi:hypothetical protein